MIVIEILPDTHLSLLPLARFDHVQLSDTQSQPGL